MEVLKKIESLSFLEDVTQVPHESKQQLSMWKEVYRVFQVKGSPNIQFRISSDWSGHWLAGAWYDGTTRVAHPDELMNILPDEAAVELAYHLDVLSDISSWRKETDRFI